MSRHTGIVAGAVGVAAVTGLGVVVGWVMDQAPWPLFGGGWREYAGGIAFVWVVTVIVLLPVLVSMFAKTATRWIVER